MSPVLTDIEFFCAVLVAVQFIDLLLHDWLNSGSAQPFAAHASSSRVISDSRTIPDRNTATT